MIRAHTAMIGRPEPGTIGQPPGGLYVDAPPLRRRSGPPPFGGRHSSNITRPLCPRDGHGLQLWPLTADVPAITRGLSSGPLYCIGGPNRTVCHALPGSGGGRSARPRSVCTLPRRSGHPCRGADGPAARRARINETPGRWKLPEVSDLVRSANPGETLAGSPRGYAYEVFRRCHPSRSFHLRFHTTRSGGSCQGLFLDFSGGLARSAAGRLVYWSPRRAAAVKGGRRAAIHEALDGWRTVGYTSAAAVERSQRAHQGGGRRAAAPTTGAPGTRPNAPTPRRAGPGPAQGAAGERRARTRGGPRPPRSGHQGAPGRREKGDQGNHQGSPGGPA